MANAEVIKFFKRKSQTGFDAPTYLGAEQRFVSALRNSNVNNLEEQLLLGTDTYTEKYIDERGNSVTEISYRISDADAAASYYKIISTTYKEGIQNEDFFFKDDILHFPNNINEVVFGDGDVYSDINMLYGNLGNTSTKKVETLLFDDDNEKLKIHPSSFTIIRIDELHYIKGTDDILVLTKTVGRKYLEDGAREVVRESITNHIAP